MALLSVGVGTSKGSGLTPTDAARRVPDAYRHQLIQQLSLADERSPEWVAAIAQCPPEHCGALAFLLANMPAGDLKALSPPAVLADIAMAYDARGATPWARQVPEAIFLNDVLPYASTTESRDPWRADFRARFAPLVKDCESAEKAARLLNGSIFETLKVAYHATKRLRPDQSPKESMAIGYASCTGLSILLVDACRSVGVPARIVGTPAWIDDSGNHTWVEIWDGRWHFLGAAEPGPLDDTWFKDKAARADATNPRYAIYAASFSRTGTPFPAVWAAGRTDLYAENVTAAYVPGTTPVPPVHGPAAIAALDPLLDGDWASMARITPRGYVCGRAKEAIVLNGRGDSADWQRAPWTEPFVDIQGDTRPPPRFRTRAKMLWDDQCLYVYAQMHEPHVWATILTKNQVIFHDNDFEIFIDPDGDGHDYHEIEINAHNTLWELSLPRPYRDGGKPIDPDNIDGLRSVVYVNGTLNDPRDTDVDWSVEVAIPWAGLAKCTGHRACPPKDGEQWRVNFSRVQWLVDIIDGRYVKIPKAMRDEDNWVWSPQGVIDMHRPERWGFVQFSSTAETSNFTPDSTLAARDCLMRFYYRQRVFFRHNGRYARSAGELGFTPDDVNGLTLTSVDDGFVAGVVAGAHRLRIDQTSRITVSE